MIKPGLCTQNTPLHITVHISFTVQDIKFTIFPMKCFINSENFMRWLFLLKLEIQKCGQIWCAHKPYFLRLGHICLIGFGLVLFSRQLLNNMPCCRAISPHNFTAQSTQDRAFNIISSKWMLVRPFCNRILLLSWIKQLSNQPF